MKYFIWSLIYLNTINVALSDSSITKKITWPKIKDASKYYIEVSTDKSFKKITKKETKTPSIDFKFKTPGTFYWRIAYYHPEYKMWSPPSKIGTIRVKDIPLEFIFPRGQNQNIQQEKVTLKWKGSVFNKSYKIKIQLPNKKVFTEKLQKESLSIRLPLSGKYIVELETFDSRNKLLQTQTTQFSYAAPAPKKLAKTKAPIKKKNSTNSDLSMFLTTSFGTFSEEFNNVSATTEQNSPYTIGLSYNLRDSKTRGYSLSTYFSYLVSTNLEGSDETTELPPEFGLTGYIDLLDKKILGWTPYYGTDIEQFSTFNSDEIVINNESIETREHQFIYATAGLSKLTSLLNRKIFMKTSLSYTLLSSSSRESEVRSGNYKGFKGIFFIASPLTKKFSLSFLLKQHLMDGPTELNITRYGFGLGYKFF